MIASGMPASTAVVGGESGGVCPPRGGGRSCWGVLDGEGMYWIFNCPCAEYSKSTDCALALSSDELPLRLVLPPASRALSASARAAASSCTSKDRLNDFSSRARRCDFVSGPEMEPFDFFDTLELPEPLCFEPQLLGDSEVGHDDLLGTDGTDGGRDGGRPSADRCAATATP